MEITSDDTQMAFIVFSRTRCLNHTHRHNLASTSPEIMTLTLLYTLNEISLKKALLSILGAYKIPTLLFENLNNRGSLLASAEIYSPKNLVNKLDLLKSIEMIEKDF